MKDHRVILFLSAVTILGLIKCSMVTATATTTTYPKVSNMGQTLRRSMEEDEMKDGANKMDESKEESTTSSYSSNNNNDDDEVIIDVYFGVGCFWHIQHEFVGLERSLLNRNDEELSSFTGYAGGTKTGDNDMVCYHNGRRIADYGRLGHSEVVGMAIPKSALVDFASFYFGLFQNGDRVDTMDKGPEYRSLMGLPNGMNNEFYNDINEAAKSSGFTLLEGKGNEKDTLYTNNIYVMDTIDFPFHQAELYHQFHDDFLSPSYGWKYNSLASQAFDDGRINYTGCPDRGPLSHSAYRAPSTEKKVLLWFCVGLVTMAIILTSLPSLSRRMTRSYELTENYESEE